MIDYIRHGLKLQLTSRMIRCTLNIVSNFRIIQCVFDNRLCKHIHRSSHFSNTHSMLCDKINYQSSLMHRYLILFVHYVLNGVSYFRCRLDNLVTIYLLTTLVPIFNALWYCFLSVIILTQHDHDIIQKLVEARMIKEIFKKIFFLLSHSFNIISSLCDAKGSGSKKD